MIQTYQYQILTARIRDQYLYQYSHQHLYKYLYKYSQTCLQRPHLGTPKSCTQVVTLQRFLNENCFLIWFGRAQVSRCQQVAVVQRWLLSQVRLYILEYLISVVFVMHVVDYDSIISILDINCKNTYTNTYQNTSSPSYLQLVMHSSAWKYPQSRTTIRLLSNAQPSYLKQDLK